MAIKIKEGITVRSFWEKPRSKLSSFKQVHNWLKETRKKNKAFSSKWVSLNRPGDRKKQLNCWCLPFSTIMASKIYFLDLFGYIRQTKHDTFYLTWFFFPSSRYKWEETGQIKKYTKWPIYPPLVLQLTPPPRFAPSSQLPDPRCWSRAALFGETCSVEKRPGLEGPRQTCLIHHGGK